MKLRTLRGAQSGEREIEATSCRGVADATSVVLALALVPSEEPASDRPLLVPATAQPHALAFGLGVAADPSTLPKTAIGAVVLLAWTPGRWRLEAAGRRWASLSGTVPGGAAGARFAMTSIGGRGCWTAIDRTIEVAPCAGADASFVSAPGFGAQANYDRSAAWATLAGGVLVRAKLAHDGTIALARLDEHATRFPQGALVEERIAARVLALCSVGRVANARVEAQRFLVARPRSPLAAQVRGSCARE